MRIQLSPNPTPHLSPAPSQIRSGAALPNAKVLVRNDATHTDRTTVSNESGNFNLTNLPPGNYTIRVEAASFQTTTLGNVHVDPNIGRRVDISMKVGDTNN